MQSDKPTMNQSAIKIALVFETGIGMLALILAWFTDISPLNQMGWQTLDLLYGLLFLLPMLFVMFGIAKLNFKPLLEIRKKLDQTLGQVFANVKSFDILLISIQAGVCEELLFRGWLEPLLTREFGFITAIIITNILFGLGHLITKLYGVIALLMGLWISYACHFTDNLLVAILIHAIYDFLALSFYLKVYPNFSTNNK